MFCVHLRRMCSLLLSDGMLYKYQLSPAHLGTSFSFFFFFGNLSCSFICVKILLLFTLINYLWLWFSFWRLWDCSSSCFFCALWWMSTLSLSFFKYQFWKPQWDSISLYRKKNQGLDLARSVKQNSGSVPLEHPGGWGFLLIKFFILPLYFLVIYAIVSTIFSSDLLGILMFSLKYVFVEKKNPTFPYKQC